MALTHLREDVQFEPLWFHWHAEPHLAHPASAALTLAYRFLPIAKSYVSAAKMHYDAARNPKFAGGSFLNLHPDRVPEVKALVEKVEKGLPKAVELATAIRELQKVCAAQSGGELESVYAQVPAALRGLVELVYDLGHHASFRFIEPLLFDSDFHVKAAQSFVLRQVTGDARPYKLTPRFPEPNALWVDLPFDHPSVRELADMRHRGGDAARFAELAGLSAEQRARFETFCTSEAPTWPKYSGEGVRVRFVGHACVLFETPEGTVLTDPGIPCKFAGASERLSFSDLPEHIDLVVLTHAHPDHAMLETLLQLQTRIGRIVVPRSNGTLVDPSLRLSLEAAGLANVIELGEFDTVRAGGFEVQALPFFGEHCDLDVRTKTIYRVRAKGKTALVLGDTNAPEPELFARLKPKVGDVDLMLVGMESEGAPMSWGYGPFFPTAVPRPFDQARRSASVTCARALPMVERLAPRRVYVYSMGTDPWLGEFLGLTYNPESTQLKDADAFVAACQARGLESKRVHGPLTLTL